MAQNFPMHTETTKIIDAQAMNANVTSTVKNINNVLRYSIQVYWEAGATPIGNLILQGSNDMRLITDLASSSAVFTDIETTALSGNTGNIMYNVENPAYSFVRIFYDNTSGNATLTATITSKN
jgi:hypothetical protein